MLDTLFCCLSNRSINICKYAVDCNYWLMNSFKSCWVQTIERTKAFLPLSWLLPVQQWWWSRSYYCKRKKKSMRQSRETIQYIWETRKSKHRWETRLYIDEICTIKHGSRILGNWLTLPITNLVHGLRSMPQNMELLILSVHQCV